MNSQSANSDLDKMYFYEKEFSEDFDHYMNDYDLKKRLQVVYEQLLTEDISQKKLLDAGCGTGWFNAYACNRNADVVSLDLGENLLKKVEEKCDSTRVVGSVLELPFSDNTFDYVVSSEVIEHVPTPLNAITEMHRVLKPGGQLIITTPSKRWYFSLIIAHRLNLRRYQGLENRIVV